jgi:hypothetical protein
MGVGFAMDFLWIYDEFLLFFYIWVLVVSSGFMEWMFGGFAVAVCSGFVKDFWWVCKGRGGVSVAWARGGSRVWVAGWLSLSLSTNHCHNPHESYTKHEHELELPMKHGTAW